MQNFLDNLNLLWLFAPDQVIKKANKFLDAVNDQNLPCTDKDKEIAVGDLVSEMRKDLCKNKIMTKTHMKPGDFQHVRTK